MYVRARRWIQDVSGEPSLRLSLHDVRVRTLRLELSAESIQAIAVFAETIATGVNLPVRFAGVRKHPQNAKYEKLQQFVGGTRLVVEESSTRAKSQPSRYSKFLTQLRIIYR